MLTDFNLLITGMEVVGKYQARRINPIPVHHAGIVFCRTIGTPMLQADNGAVAEWENICNQKAVGGVDQVQVSGFGNSSSGI